MTTITVLIIFFLDRLSKFLVTRRLDLNESIPVIKNIFHISLVHNTGAAFGILKGQAGFFVFTTVCAVVLIIFAIKKDELALRRFSLSLILAGALGNLVDRIVYGYVIDMFDFRIWPVFNIADSAITTGALLLAFTLFKRRK